MINEANTTAAVANTVISTSATPQEVTAYLTRQDTYNPATTPILRYSRPNDIYQGQEVHLANMSNAFGFKALGREWKGTEYLYLCGEWSEEAEKSVDIQKDILTATSGYAAKRFKKSKYLKFIREDYNTFRHHWMLWCIWQKCLDSEAFRKHLLSFSEDTVIVEVVKDDPIWAAEEDPATGLLKGGNAVGKILMICRKCIKEGTQPAIDTDLLNRSGIYILGQRVQF